MTAEARALNSLYLAEMESAPAASVLGRLRDLWWPGFVACHATEGAAATIDKLDVFMGAGRAELGVRALAHAALKGEPDTDRYRLATNQFLKSNTGKMFERFVGLALAYSLREADAPFCVQPFRTANFPYCHGLTRDDFKVTFKFGDGTLFTHIDADVFAFNPSDPNADIFMISVKSTLKDRFHNVPFWNLLRRCAMSEDFPEVAAQSLKTLERLKYVAVCSDLAAEQPDFGTDTGARNLLQVDASLLDGAYVTASKALGLPTDCSNHLGDVRQHAFYRYSCLLEHLSSNAE